MDECTSPVLRRPDAIEYSAYIKAHANIPDYLEIPVSESRIARSTPSTNLAACRAVETLNICWLSPSISANNRD